MPNPSIYRIFAAFKTPKNAAYEQERMSGFVHIDATYWGRSWGIILVLDNATNMPLYVAFIKSETTLDYNKEDFMNEYAK